MLSIKILGPGCANCKRLAQIVQKTVDQIGVPAQLIIVTDYQQILEYSLMATPGLVINEKVVCSGRIPSPTEVKSWLTAAFSVAG